MSVTVHCILNRFWYIQNIEYSIPRFIYVSCLNFEEGTTDISFTSLHYIKSYINEGEIVFACNLIFFFIYFYIKTFPLI